MSLNVKLTPKYTIPQTKLYVGADNIFTTNKAKYSKAKSYMVTENANTCVMLGLSGGGLSNCLMHLSPEQQSLNSLRSDLEKCVQKIKDNFKNIEEDIIGILVGGRNSQCKASFDLFDNVAKTLDYMGIPFSMICGKRDNIANDNMAMSGNSVTVWNESLKDLEIPENPTQSQLEDILSQNYEVVELDSEAPVKFITK